MARGGGVGDDGLAAVDDVGEEFIGDVLVGLFVIDIGITVGGAEEVLADEDGGLGGVEGGLGGLAVIDDHGAGGGEGEFAGVVGDVEFGGFEGEIEDAQGEHHVAQLAHGRIGQHPLDVGGRQGDRGGHGVEDVVGRQVGGVDEGGVLGFDEDVVVVVFGPFLGFVDGEVELADTEAAVEVVGHVAGRS